MGKSATTPIDDIFAIEKGYLQSSKCTPGNYDFITAAEQWKTHDNYSHKCEALIFAAAASGSLGRTHYINGKFIASDLCFILTPKNVDNYPVNIKFYYFVFNSLRDELVKKTKTGTSKEAINQSNFKKCRIPYFELDKQNLWVSKLENTIRVKESLMDGISRQQILIKKLRQSILQEAVQGKLTAKWRKENPDVEPASKLLERIKAEKEKLFKEKKIKKQKPLPPIKDDEIPFTIPKSWAWCRLGGISYIFAGNSFKSHDFKKNKGVKCIKITNAGVRKLIETGDYLPIHFVEKFRDYLVFQGDLIIALTRPYIKDGLKISVCPESYNNSLLNQRVAAIRFLKFIDDSYIYKYLCSDVVLNKYKDRFEKVNQQPNLKMSDLTDLLVPLAPIKEQKIISITIDKLLSECKNLESQIEQSKENSELLMQAVLLEAFEG